MAVVIPSLHPSRDLLMPFLEAVQAEGFGHIVVVDDGSGPEYKPVFDEVSERLRCVVLHHDVNHGKGRALKTAFEYCETLDAGIEVLVTADSDGQHSPHDLVRVAERVQELLVLGRPAAVLGVRRFDADDVPRRSRLGNTATTRVVQLFFGRRLSDTQTGLRGFPMPLAARSAHVEGERFDYEMNVVLWLLSTRTEIDEIPIETIYHDLENSVSHFRPVVDSSRIYSAILRQFAKFSGASLASALLDLILYVAILDLVFVQNRLPEQVALAVVVARIGSSLFNYALNKWLVFRDDSRPAPSLIRYYTLASVILVASALGTTALSSITRGHDVWAKIIVDGVLFLVSYLIQERWVFRDRTLETA